MFDPCVPFAPLLVSALAGYVGAQYWYPFEYGNAERDGPCTGACTIARMGSTKYAPKLKLKNQKKTMQKVN